MNYRTLRRALYNRIRANCPKIRVLRAFFTKSLMKKYREFYLPDTEAYALITPPPRKKTFISRYLSECTLVKKLREEMETYHVPQECFEDVLFYNKAFGITAQEYHFFHFSEKDDTEKREYISGIKWKEYFSRMNDLFDGEVYYNKVKTYPFLKEFYHRDALVFNRRTTLPQFSAFVSRHNVFVEKIGISSLGADVKKVTISTEEELDWEYQRLKNSGSEYLLEELIEQSADMSVYNKSSVNTIRAISFVTKDGVIIPYCGLRIGKKGAFVDNAGSGGLSVGVDVANGALISDGYDKEGNTFTCIFDTDIPFRGRILPAWDKAISTVKALALMLPSCKVVGWDLAHTKDGWVVVEANERCQISIPQMVYQHGINTEVKDIMRNIDLFIQ